MPDDRPFDLVLYGATGFTGGLVARYLARRLDLERVRWALAGRSASKLGARRRELERDDSRLADVGLIEASSDDPESLRAMCRQAKLVMTTVGPYARYGEPLVSACVEERTHYLDLTGEPLWWQAMVDRYHERAAANETLIIPCCGFDSIPYDAGALFTAAQLPSDQPLTIDAYAYARGSFSGGTWASAIDAMRQTGKASRGTGSGSGGPRPRIHFAEDVGRWAVPAPTIDPMVVRRSVELMPQNYGTGLRYREYFAPKNLINTAGLLAGVGVLVAATRFGPTRKLLAKVRPPGEGPSPEQRARSWFRVDFVGRGGGREVRTHVSGGDPGYDETAKMMSEAALTLLEDFDELPLRGGVVTPAAALGMGLIERLQSAGMEFAVD